MALETNPQIRHMAKTMGRIRAFLAKSFSINTKAHPEKGRP
jgi:hypothetical protein